MIRFVALFTFLLLSSHCFSQTYTNEQKSEGFYHFFYNEKPDSVFLNGEPHELEKEIRYSLPAGTYTLRAVKNCYLPFESQVTVVAGKTRQFNINFEKIQSDKTQLFKRSFPFDIAMAGTGVALISTIDNGPKYGVPALLSGLLGYVLWRARMKNELDLCSGNYSGTPSDGDGWRLRFGVSGNTGAKASLTSTGEDEFLFINPNGPNIQFLYNLEAELTKNPESSFSEGTGFSLALEKLFSRHFGISMYGQYIPKVNLLLNHRVEGRRSGVAADGEFQDEKSLMMFGADFLIALNRSPHHQISLVVGGYGSNTISGSVEQLLIVNSSVTDEPTTEFNYEYSARGIKAGLRSDFWILNNTGLWLAYEFLAQDNLSVLNDSESNTQFVFQMGLMREF